MTSSVLGVHSAVLTLLGTAAFHPGLNTGARNGCSTFNDDGFRICFLAEYFRNQKLKAVSKTSLSNNFKFFSVE